MKCIRFFFLIPILFCMMLEAQTPDPPYPRLGLFTFTAGRSDYMEANLDLIKDFDIIAFPPTEGAALAYRAQDPDRIILGTSGCMIAYGMSNIPDCWYYRMADGSRQLLFGSSYLMNLTINCPLVDRGNGPERFIDYAARHLLVEMDFSLYDGVFYDWWWSGMGSYAKTHGDLDSSGVADYYEWFGGNTTLALDSLRYVWQEGLRQFHTMQNALPGNPYSVLQVGADWNIWPYVNGVCFEDWPVLNGLFKYWRQIFNDTQTQDCRDPRMILMNASHRHYQNQFPVTPYKNNFKAVRFALGACLLTSGYFFVDEGNAKYPDYNGVLGNGHHGNTHIYDEMAGKGRLGYPLTDMLMIPGKTLAATPYADGVWIRFFDNGVSVVNATGVDQSVYASDLAALDPAGPSSYYRFRGGQDPEFNNGCEVTDADPLVLWGSTAVLNGWTYAEVFGDGTMLFREPDTLITPIIIDNHVNNYTSPGSERINHAGSWNLTSDGEKFYAYYTQRNYGPFQPDGFAWSYAGSGSNTAVYVPTIGLAGFYEVSEWHGYRGNEPTDYPNATNVPVHLEHAGGDTVILVNQSVNHAQWNSLGVYPFIEGTTGQATLSNQANGYVMADAMKFAFIRGFTEAEADSFGAGGGHTAMFTDITDTHLGNSDTGTYACCFADINGDDRPDLYLSRYRGTGSTDLCLINGPDNTFTEEAASRGIQDLDDGSQGACWGDLDNDGDYDLVNGTTIDWPNAYGDHNDVYRNNGSGIFTNETPTSMLSTLKKTRSVLILDLEGNGDLDIFTVSGYMGTNDETTWNHPNEVYRNEGLFAFTKLGAVDCGDLEGAPAGQGSVATDLDNDGDIDVIACNQTGDLNVLLNNGSGDFMRVSPVSDIGINHRAGEGISSGDVDNDGDMDLLLVSEGPPNIARLYFNDGDGTFTYSGQSWSDINGYMGGFADIDNDRDLDLVFAGHAQVLLNDGAGVFANGPAVPYAY
ncbi:VCBS repeat-containing protein, partial [bacterium]|nr:VCBS repeat-containing protein [bacterium]